MRKKRSEVFDPMVRGTYHVYSRCARKRWLLCQKDKDRRERLLEILEELAAIYAIAILASAFLSNHFHVVLTNLPELVKRWTDEEVIIRAQRAYPNRFVQMGIYRAPTDEQMKILLRDKKFINEMRRRLSDISWMMRMLKQRFAAEVNKDMGETGCFWDGRFKMVEVKSEAQLIVTLIYIALNQVKAGQASTLDTSFWTSVCIQLQARQMWLEGDVEAAAQRDGFLSPLTSADNWHPPSIPGGQLNSRRASDAGTLEMPLKEFMRLVECAYELHQGKRSQPSPRVATLMKGVNLSTEQLRTAIETAV